MPRIFTIHLQHRSSRLVLGRRKSFKSFLLPFCIILGVRIRPEDDVSNAIYDELNSYLERNSPWLSITLSVSGRVDHHI